MSDIAHKSTLTRRHFLQWIGGAALTAGAMAGYIRLIEPRWLSIEYLEIPIPDLSPTLDGRRIAQLSDIHLSKYFSPERLATALQEVERQAPDWLMLTGDFVGSHAEAAAGLVEPLRRLSMPIYAIFGNHDLWTDRATVWRYLQEANATVLLNDACEIEANLWLAGLDDLWSGDPDLGVAMRNVPPGAPTILLEHEPDYFDTVLRENAPITLQLSGHSHGGQVRLPTLNADAPGLHSYAPVLPAFGRRYPIGLRQFKTRYVYTNRGLGVWPLPFRFNCPPELTLITLRSA